MHLKKLSLIGFKSFPEPTEVEFGPGMTGIVGPNGCGKTNILDALRWVLGEQRTSALRSNKMEEVIFNGSRDAKPLGMSEVSVTIANSRGVLPTEYTDLSITRRLYRSGESEYRLNKQPCRLRDILDLFADTGMGAHSYSVIQQDMIDAILSEKAEERRFLFDEAAGISRYKHRKKAAIRKLEATDADLLRLRDIVAEVRTRVISLKRQSNKAQRYTECKAQWEQLHLRLARSDFESLQERARTQDVRARNLKADVEGLRAGVTSREAERESLQAAVETADREVDRARQEVASCDQELHEIDSERGRSSAQAQAGAARLRELVHDLETLAGQRRDRERQIEELSTEIATAAEEAEAAREAALTCNTARAEAESGWQEARAHHARAKQAAEQAQGQCRGLEAERAQAETVHAGLAESRTQAEAAADQAGQAALQLQTAKKTSEESEETTRTRADTALTALRESRQKRDLAQAEYDRTEAALKAAQTAHGELESEHQVLASWMETYRGYRGAVPALLTHDRPEGLHDTVAELIRPHADFELPVAAALGEQAEFLVCRDRATADLLLQRLEDSDVGRANLIIMGALGETEPRHSPLEGAQPLSEQVTVRSGFEPLARFLLNDFFYWSGEGTPDTEALPRDVALVTASGRVYRGRAEAAAGRPAAASLLARKDELSRLATAIAEKAAAVDDVQRNASRHAAALSNARSAVTKCETGLAEAQEEFRRAGLEAERARVEAASAVAEVERASQTQQSLNARLTELEAQIAGLQGAFSEAESRHAALQADAETAARALDVTEEGRTRTMLSSGEAQVHAVSTQGRLDGLQSDRERTQEMLLDVQTRVAAAIGTLLETGRKRRELATRLAELTSQHEHFTRTRVERQAIYQQSRADAAQVQVELQEQDGRIKTARKELDSVSTNHHAAEMAASEARLEVANLAERIRDAHGVELEACSDLEPVEPNQRGLLTAEASDLKRRLDQMGSVNLLALDEYNEQKERLDFLEGQLADTEAAKKTLLETIEKINLTAHTLFVETFHKVEENFSTLFQQLFEGGDARVHLDTPEDPLESSISIMARPRGKRPVSILQLSGGERALTAIALLFALYMVKPSPFCILDEIDAPLDDANIGRFLSIIERFASQTQFIVITHNKMTMQASDVLYGVTMEDPGISKVVSVKLTDALEVAAPLMAFSLKRLTTGLKKTQANWVARIKEVVGAKERLDDDTLEMLEELLLTGDVGVATSGEVVSELKADFAAVDGAESALARLKEHLVQRLQKPSPVNARKPEVTLLVGVNGTGKTTTAGKLAHHFKAQDRKVLLAACDTFRAAATDQLKIWADRAGVDMISGQPEGDPAAVAHDAIRAAVARGADCLLLDTAGRLHTKTNLMAEMEKIARVVDKVLPGAPHEVLLVLDATTGQNGLRQAMEFHKSVGLTGVVLTKLDSTSRGGIIFAIADALKVPVRYVGLGESVHDLDTFDPETFVDALFATGSGVAA